MFGYEIINPKFKYNSSIFTKTPNIVTYNFQSLLNQDRIFIFLSTNPTNYYSPVNSIAELFFAANWLEREVSELNNINFTSKKDLRNLMLQYGDSSAPFQKSFPTIGLKEMYYEPLKDELVQNSVSIQL